ncbi:MAG: fibronectin type III domain-containing protein [Ignavibacteriae bacterium]|nr:fibronectin type III domain-containing protein [Ignavibacteriota bacterium]
MKKYILETLNRLNAFLQGMKKNPTDWTGEPVKSTDVQSSITDLTTKGEAIDAAESASVIARHSGSLQNSESKSLLSQCETFAYAIYANQPDKLAEYGMKPRKDPSKIPPPTEVLAVVLEDDSDAEGFLIGIKARDKNADSYEWQKGQSLVSTDLTNIPQLFYFKTTSKISFIDDNIIKGVRYFFRVRAANRNGYGPWSEAASRVQ